MNVIALTLLAVTLSGVNAALAQGKDDGRLSSDPELAALQHQNAILEEKIKLRNQQAQIEKLHNSDPLARQSEAIYERARLNAQEQSLLKVTVPRITSKRTELNPGPGDDTFIESTRMAYTALSSIAPEVAKLFACGGKNIVLYGPSHSEALLTVRTFKDQLDLLNYRLKSVLDIQAPTAPDQKATAASLYSVAALSRPVLQSVLDLVALFHSDSLATPDVTADQTGLIALVANAATAQGCIVYWPDQYVANPFNAGSQVMAGLQALGDLNDNGGAAGKPAGLQQRIRALRTELNRAEVVSRTLSQKIEKEQTKLTDATKKVDALKIQIDFISGHIKDQKNAALQDKLNRTFEKSWEELEQAVRKQLGSGLPGTMEEQGKLGEMSKRLDVLKTRTDWLSQYVKDEKDLQLQDKLKRTLSAVWDQLDAAVKNQQALTVSVPVAIEPDQKEQQLWDKYSADLRELITTTVAASEAYMTFRGALLDGSSGTSPLNRMLRAEGLRDLTFDEKFQALPGSSVVQLTLQKLTGTTKVGTNEKESFSGGVVLSFVQYEPNGKVKNSGVQTAYAGFGSKP